ncbi:MAG: hypothetical protein ABI614_06090 [Planctomycetota bacterium]
MSTTKQGSHQPDTKAAPARHFGAKRTMPHSSDESPLQRKLRIYSHSSFFYLWPVWAVGFVMALLTYFQGKAQQIEAAGQAPEWIHPNTNLGVVYFAVLFLVTLITNFSVRGLASALVVMGGALLTVVLAYVGWWDEIFSWFGNLTIHLSLGAYFWFSTLMFLAWAAIVFGLDRLSYWEVTAGQLTNKSLFGAGSQSYNTQGMGLEKHRDDLFRHWLLGFGSGDLRIRTSGATREQIDLTNVLFIGSKVNVMQRLIAEVPEEPESG